MSENNRTVRARLGKERTARFEQAMQLLDRTEPDIVRRALDAYLSQLSVPEEAHILGGDKTFKRPDTK